MSTFASVDFHFDPLFHRTFTLTYSLDIENMAPTRFADADELMSAFDFISVKLMTDAEGPSRASIVIAVPSEDAAAASDDTYVNHIEMTLSLALLKRDVELRGVSVTVKDASKSSSTASHGQALALTYENLLVESGVKFTLDDGELAAAGGLLALVIQMITDSTDTHLSETLAAAAVSPTALMQQPPRKENSGASRASSFDDLQQGQQNCDSQQQASLPKSCASSSRAGPWDTAMHVRVTCAKIDHMNDAAMYTKAVSGEVDNLAITGDGSGDDRGIVGCLMLRDPISARVIVAILSVIADADDPQEACAGSALWKSLRTMAVDIDGYGRKCRERMMRDLGSFSTAITSPAVRKQLLAAWRGQRLMQVTPATREEGVVLLKNMFLAPLLQNDREAALAVGHSENDIACGKVPPPCYLKTALQIFDDPELYKHV